MRIMTCDNRSRDTDIESKKEVCTEESTLASGSALTRERSVDISLSGETLFELEGGIERGGERGGGGR